MNPATPPHRHRLYRLLPAHYRKRDEELGGLLRHVLDTIDDELLQVEDDITNLYENWFIETCEPWVVPYLGDLLGASDLGYVTFSDLRPRALVARVFDYRRKRGTAAGLEAVCRDVLGFAAHVLEYDQETRCHVDPSPSEAPREHLSLLLSESSASEVPAGGDDGDGRPARHLAMSVERPYSGPGRKPLLGDLGLFLQRFPRQTLRGTQAYALDKDKGHYTVHPLGYDTPLFCRTSPDRRIPRSSIAALCGRLTADELSAFTDALYGPQGHLQLHRNTQPIAASDIAFTDLSEFRTDPEKILVDPERGRIALRAGDSPRALLVDHTSAFGAHMAAGGYPRTPYTLSLQETLPFQCRVDRFAPTSSDDVAGPPVVASLSAALDLWRDAGRPSGAIRITDSCRHSVRNQPIDLPAGVQLVIEAASGARPVLYSRERGEPEFLRLQTTLPADEQASAHGKPARLALDGIVIEGALAVDPGAYLQLTLQHCTILSTRVTASGSASAALDPSLVVGDPRELGITLSSCLIGPLIAPADGTRIEATKCLLIHATRGATHNAELLPALAGSSDGHKPGPDTTLDRCTVVGRVHVRALQQAQDSLLCDPLAVERRQTGVMQRCYVRPPSEEHDGPSRPPGRLGCVPAGTEDEDLSPVLLSTRYGDPGFLQLAQQCDRSLRLGADDSGEMGAFCDARRARREIFLDKILADYVPLGLNVDIFYID